MNTNALLPQSYAVMNGHCISIYLEKETCGCDERKLWLAFETRLYFYFRLCAHIVLYAEKLSICTYMSKNASAQGGKMSNPLELKLLAIVSHPLPCWGSNLVPLQGQCTLS